MGRSRVIHTFLGLLLAVAARGQASSTNTITGSISVAGERDVFTFNLTNRARYYFDALTNVSTLNWSLEGPAGVLVDQRSFTVSDAGFASTPILPLGPGFHRLTIDCDAANTNSYAFRLVDLAAATLIVPGTVVSNTLSPANETDFYQFASAAGDRLMFDRLSLTAGASVFWRLIDPFGNEVFGQAFNDVNAITQRVAGTYTLLLEGAISESGTSSYSFNVVLQGNAPPSPFSGTAITIGSIVAGTLTNASTNAYTFTLANETRLVLDTLTNSLNLQWSLDGPPGAVTANQPLNGSDGSGSSSSPVLSLPAGEYQVRIRRITSGTNGYRFRLLDLGTATPITPGTPVFGTLAPSSETRLYQFSASAGSRFYFDFFSTNGPPSTYWRLIGPLNNQLEWAAIFSDRGPRVLTVSGTYTLTIEGYYGDDPGSQAYRFNVVPVVDGAQTLTIGALTTGSISVPGQAQQFLFTIPPVASSLPGDPASLVQLYFDSRTNHAALHWSLAGPGGAIVNNRAFNASDGPNGFGVLTLWPGDYTLTVTGTGDATGGFAFRLFDLASAAPLIPGIPVTSTLSPANETDAYRFSVAPGTKVFFDSVSVSGLPSGFWRCVDRFGATVASTDTYLTSPDPGVQTLTVGGVYTLLIEGWHSDPAMGTYTVNVVPVTDGQQSLTIGALNSGNISVPGQVQRYRFTLPSAASVYFDFQTNNANLQWTLVGPAGVIVTNRSFIHSDAGNAIATFRLAAGDYTLALYATADNTGGFTFRVIDLATAAPLTPGIPVSHALSPANQTDPYRFSAAAGQKAYFDLISSTGMPSAYWRCLDPTGAQLFGAFLGDQGPFLLPISGIYTLLIEGSYLDTGSGNYTVNVVPVTDGVQVLTLGTTNAGTIAFPGQSQLYLFSLTSRTTVYFDVMTNNSNLRVTLDGPVGHILNNAVFSSLDAINGNPLLDLAPGEYTLTVTALSDAIGPYRFRLFDIAAATSITAGAPVSGLLSPASATAAYRLNAAAGDRFFFDWISNTGMAGGSWKLYDPFGNRVFVAFNADGGTNRLNAAGAYTLLVEGAVTDSGSGAFQFNVSFVSNAPTQFVGTPLVIGNTVNGNLASATSTNVYVFSLAAPARLFFDSLTNVDFSWWLQGPPGTMVNNRSFQRSDSFELPDSSINCPAGNYRLTVSGAAGPYAFRLLDAAAAIPFTPGTVISGSVAPGRGTSLYRFNAVAGDRFYLDGQSISGFSTSPYAKVLGPFGNLVTSVQLTTDADTFSVPHTGSYILSVEGRYVDTGTNGSFSFLLQPVLDETNSFAVGDLVTGAIAYTGQRQFHTFNLASAARVFFDSLTGVGTLNWTLIGPGGTIVNQRDFWSSDSFDANSLLNLDAGSYTIVVDATATNALSYQFRLIDSSAAVPITVGALVTGTLAPGNSTALYRFTANAGDRVYYDGRATSNFTAAPFIRLYAPLGAVLLSSGVAFDQDVFTLPQTGTYLISVEGRYLDTSTNGTFSFLFHPVVDSTNTFGIGETVTAAISVPGQSQFHQFTLTEPARLFFDTLSNSGITWTLTGPQGVIVNSRQLWSSDGVDGNPLLDLAAGSYTMMFNLNAAALDSYSFRLINSTSTVPFSVGALVTGSLAPGNSTTLYRFAGSAGTQLFYDGRPTSGFAAQPYVRIIAPSGNQLFAPVLANSDHDIFTLPQTGDYILAVEGRYLDTSPSGSFSFLLVSNRVQAPVPLFDTNLAPDLAVTGAAINPSAGLQSGQSATVSWTTLNTGSSATAGSFVERVTVRNSATSQVIVNRTLLYDELESGAIDPGQARARQLMITLPDGAAGAGLLEITVTTDTLNNIFEQNGAGTGEANNATVFSVSSGLAPYPDLQLASLSVAPPSGWLTGSTVTVSWVITNTGSRTTSGSWSESLLVRNTNTAQIIVNAATNYEVTEPGNGDMAPGASRARTLGFVMPADSSAFGAFEVTVTTDNANQLFELNAQGSAETNNSRTLLSLSAPDLVVNGLTISANPSLQAGADLTVQWNTANQGNVPANSFFYDRVTVRNTNTAEILFNSTLPYNPSQGTNGAIGAGSSRARQQIVHLPEGARSVGGLEIIVTADTLNSLVEHNASGTAEANNAAQTLVTVGSTPYPDLVVTNIVVPAAGQPGRQVPFIWTIRNNGSVPAVGPWTDQLFLSADTFIGGDQYLASVFFNGTLGPGQSLTRTQQVTLPAFGNGNRFFTAEVDAGNAVFEENETNNSAVSSASLNIPAALTLTLSPGTVLENAGAQGVLATVVRNSDAASPLVVTIGNNRPDKLVAPGTVTIPFAATSTNFFFQVLDDSIADSNIIASITASAAGHSPATNTLTIVENDFPALNLRLSAASVAENAPAGAVTGMVTRNAGTNSALTVTLSSDRPGSLGIPSNVVIPAGRTNATFVLAPVDDDLVTGNRSAVIFASASGFATVSAPIVVLDNDTTTLSLQLSQTAVDEDDINPAAVAIVTRAPVSSGALRVQLGTNGGGGIQIPSEVVIPANQPAVSFNVVVRDDTLAFGSRTVNITAEARASDGSAIAGASATAALAIRENDGPTLSLSAAAAVIREGSNTIVTLTRNTPPTNALAVTLSAAPGSQMLLPGAVIIPLGASSTNVVVQGAIDGVTDGAQEVTITADSPGYNSGTLPITVTDIDVPDLAVSEVIVPTTVLSDTSISVVWTVTNSGLATATAPWVDEVYLAADSQGANAILITSVTNSASVPAGDSYSFSRSFVLPSDPGNNWIVIRTDVRNSVLEGSERNNSAISAAIDVQPSYRATVSTLVDSAVSGTPIPLTGQTFFSGSGLPAPFRTATVRVNVNQSRRTFSVLSDANGNFSGVFQPIPGEAGLYTIGADHPRVRQDPAQDQFVLLGMGAVPWEMNVRLAPNTPATGRIELRNLSPLPLSGLLVAPENLPLDFAATTTVETNGLGGSGTNYIDYAITTTLTTPVQGQFNLLVTTAEGATLRIPVTFTVRPPLAQLASEPASLDRGMLRGAQTVVQFDVVNQGGAASGDLTVALPVVPWLSLISTSPIPSLLPGARSTVVLALNPADDLPLTRYDGTIVLNGDQAALTMPFHFRALSEARGDLVLNMTDEHTYYASGAPKVSNAVIILRDPITGEVVTNGASDFNGEVRFNNLMEGEYVAEASAPNHSRVRAGIHVAPGVSTSQEVFLSRQEVTYEWRVVPTTVEDHYRVVLQPLFETEVPQPNLVVENPHIVPLVVPGRVSQFAIRLRNTGLIALQRVRIPVPSHPSLLITPLATEIEEIPPQTTISVPVTIRVRSDLPEVKARLKAGGGGCPGDLCVIEIPIDTRFRCGQNFITKTADVRLEVVCVPDTGCDFESLLDSSSPTFLDDSLLAHRAEWDCALGHMDECNKARIRGYLRSGDLGSVFFPPDAAPPPLSTNGFGLSAFCACGPPDRIPTLFNFGSNFIQSLGFNLGGGTTPTVSFVAATVPGPCNVPAKSGSAKAATGPGVCARVRLELSQDITMTRAAFQGTLVLDNGGSSDLTDIQLTLDFRDGANQSAGTLFGIRGPTLRGISAIDGSGVLAAGATGSAEYVFVPTLDAAPSSPRSYYIAGTLRFTLDGQQLVIPLLPGEVTVLPEARLQLEYFQQRDVFSDDPFTPEIEPAEPFALGLRVHNAGAGIARNFRIASAAPRISENEKGLLIDFKLLGAHVDDAPLNPSFNLTLGNINPNQTRIVVWDMTSTLQGKFIDLRASFEHVDDFGATNFSLIESVNVHEMIHLVRADRAGDDVLPDFLVNDSPDPDNLPDIVYLSEGSNAPVSLGINPFVSGPVTTNSLQVQLTAIMPAGWTYLRMTNPAPDFRLVSVRRSDGRVLRVGDNAWTTDRTFPSSIPGALREKTLHLFDFDSTGSYTLSFAPILHDTNAPASSVAPLPAASASSFAVQWSGSDEAGGSGIAWFDIYVSVNGGAFTNWLAHTTLQSAIFDGVNGNTYAFYSRATDLAGNQQIIPITANAQTVASGANSQPTLAAIGDASINEGSTFTLLASAVDTDVPRQTLTFSMPVAPAGASIDPAFGAISWQTGEADGGSTNLFTVVVSDGGLPSLSFTQSFHVVVREVNSAPAFIGPNTDLAVDEQTSLSYTAAASDSDLPANQLTWQIGPGAPAGLTVNSSNGLLTWLPGESAGPGEYPVTVTVRDNGSPGLSANRTFRILVREVNRAPTLAPISPQATLVETTLTVTNAATDPDLPAQQFFYSLAPGAPRGARVDRTTGTVTWTPSRDYAESTNRMTVRVTDNGVPSLTAEQSFSVIVGHLLDVSSGPSIVLAGQTGSVPIVIFTTALITNVQFNVEVGLNRLQNFSLGAPLPPLASALLQPLGSNRYSIRLGTLAGQSFPLGQSSIDLRFNAAPGLPSTYVPLQATAVSGLQIDGTPMPRALGRDGRVVYLGSEPLLELLPGGFPFILQLYGNPAPSYTIESTFSLSPPPSWTPIWTGPASNLLQRISIAPTNPVQFLRARQP